MTPRIAFNGKRDYSRPVVKMVPRKDARGPYWDVETFYMKEPMDKFYDGQVPTTHLCLPMADEEAIFRVTQLMKIYVGDYADTEKSSSQEYLKKADERTQALKESLAQTKEEEIPGFLEASSTWEAYTQEYIESGEETTDTAD